MDVMANVYLVLVVAGHSLKIYRFFSENQRKLRVFWMPRTEYILVEQDPVV
jgi:hypothetical protein